MVSLHSATIAAHLKRYDFFDHTGSSVGITGFSTLLQHPADGGAGNAVGPGCTSFFRTPGLSLM
jgi:hypothetical protein